MHAMSFGGHEVVVQDDGQSRNVVAHSGLEVQSGHSEGSITHKIDAKFVRGGKFGAHDQAQTRSERMGFAPAEITPGRRSAIKWDELIAWASRIMCDDDIP